MPDLCLLQKHPETLRDRRRLLGPHRGAFRGPAHVYIGQLLDLRPGSEMRKAQRRLSGLLRVLWGTLGTCVIRFQAWRSASAFCRVCWASSKHFTSRSATFCSSEARHKKMHKLHFGHFGPFGPFAHLWTLGSPPFRTSVSAPFHGSAGWRGSASWLSALPAPTQSEYPQAFSPPVHRAKQGL